MWMMLRVIPMMWGSVRPSRVADMPAVVNTFWIRKGYEGLTFFGHILTHNQSDADKFNAGYNSLKNHEMIHLRQAQSCGDSWVCFYLLYIWYWLKIKISRKKRHFCVRNAAYLLNPFEMEAYARMYDLDYLKRCEGGAHEWRRYAKMSIEERLRLYEKRKD
jgi:hypothetical protein